MVRIMIRRPGCVGASVEVRQISLEIAASVMRSVAAIIVRMIGQKLDFVYRFFNKVNRIMN